ncbi:hypothetical protein Y032_0356g3353 [Ancylostoma ceylanicum]|uniref:Uncharacterized protein n=1 Tax=Ancylostoma ceylanicum TaxID=53326 RepID=A0A016RW40_9BILA|nr:hypothetical protein Y032_0356g3353 [Ancylostoma ceylanicum]
MYTPSLSELHKFNYLLNALKGEALEAVKKFQVTRENYAKALDFLKNKYGNTEELVFRLIDKLDSCSLRSPAIRDQRKLLEQIQVVVTQLEQKGENVNSQWLIRRILSKFPHGIQRRVLVKKQTLTMDNTFTMDMLFQLLEETISNEEMVTLYTGGNDRSAQSTSTRVDNKSKQVRFAVSFCMYCKGNHESFECDKYKTPQERSRYLRDHKLCLICASPQHITSQCQRRPCFSCQQRHHTSCCFQSGSKRWNSIPENELNYKKEARRTSTGGKKPKLFKSSVKVNQLGNEEQEHASLEEQSILEVQSGKCFQSKQGTFLPTGELTVMNPTTRKLRKVDVLLDTGAEISFIDTTLAEELQLPTIKETMLRLHTFGSDKVKEKRSRKVPLEVWDTEGRPLSLVLFTHDILTKPFATAPVCEKDLVFLSQQNLSVNFSKNKSTVKPSILLGCDQLWTLLRKNEPHLQLPSGLHLLPTRLGYLVTGQVNQSAYVETQEDEMAKWDGYRL